MPVRRRTHYGAFSGGGAAAFSPEAEALFARFTTPPSVARKTAINDVIAALKASGVWTKLDALYLMAAADSQAAARNWVADQYNLTAVNSPTFTADRGYAGNGSSSYLRTNYNPTTAVAPTFIQDSAHISVGSRTARGSADTIQIGGVISGVGFTTEIGTRMVTNTLLGRVNNALPSTGGTVANSNSDGRFIVSRTGAASYSAYRNGASLGALAGTLTSGAPLNIETYLCALNLSGTPSLFTTDQLTFASIGGGLTSGEAASFDAAITAYLTAVGA